MPEPAARAPCGWCEPVQVEPVDGCEAAASMSEYDEQRLALDALRNEIRKQNDLAELIQRVGSGVVWKALADVIAGQISGAWIRTGAWTFPC